jgi:hypothetical protein
LVSDHPFWYPHSSIRMEIQAKVTQSGVRIPWYIYHMLSLESSLHSDQMNIVYQCHEQRNSFFENFKVPWSIKGRNTTWVVNSYRFWTVALQEFLILLICFLWGFRNQWKHRFRLPTKNIPSTKARTIIVSWCGKRYSNTLH